MRHFTYDELKRLNCAVSAYIHNKTDELSQQNCGDSEWTEVEEYKKLNYDIINEMFNYSS